MVWFLFFIVFLFCVLGVFVLWSLFNHVVRGFQGDFAASFFDCERVCFFVQLGRPPLFGSKYGVRQGFGFGCFSVLLFGLIWKDERFIKGY